MESFTVTDAAARKATALRDVSPEITPEHQLRVAVRPGGCSGFSYEMFFDDETDPSDTVLEVTPNGASSPMCVVLDDASLQLLSGATLTFTDTLNKSGFSIDNPNASRTCGCGQSFS